MQNRCLDLRDHATSEGSVRARLLRRSSIGPVDERFDHLHAARAQRNVKVVRTIDGEVRRIRNLLGNQF